MIFPAIYLLTLIFTPSLPAEDDFCKNVFIERKLEDAFNCRNSTTAPINLSKESALEIINSTDSYREFDEGNAFTLHCCFYSQPYCPNITWYKDGKQINQKQRQTEFQEQRRTLVQFNADKASGGNYTCTASTPYGEYKTHTIQVNITDKDFCEDAFADGYEDFSSCTVFRPTDLTNSTQEQEPKLKLVDATDSYVQLDIESKSTLDCCFYSQPYCAAITWYKDGVMIKDEVTTKIMNHGRTLQIYATRNSGGNYTCNATTPSGVIGHTMHVKVSPRRCSGDFNVIKNPEDKVIKVKRGHRQVLKLHFVCEGKLPTTTVECRRNNKEEISADNDYYNITRNRPSGKNVLPLEHIITISNFSRSENITCKTNAENSPSATFVLVEDEVAVVQHEFVGPEESFFKEKGVWILIGGSFLLCVIVAVLSFLRYKSVRRKPPISYRPNQTDVAARYDAFISYSEADGGSFVRSTLAPMLEDECGYKLSLHYREFVPGTSIIDNIIDTIYDSRRIVTIITPNFLVSEWCKFEVDHGLRRLIEKPNSLVVIMLREMPKSQLPKSLRAFLSDVTFLLWDDGKRDEMVRKLKKALGSPNIIDNNIDTLRQNEIEVDIDLEESKGNNHVLKDNANGMKINSNSSERQESHWPSEIVVNSIV